MRENKARILRDFETPDIYHYKYKYSPVQSQIKIKSQSKGLLPDTLYLHFNKKIQGILKGREKNRIQSEETKQTLEQDSYMVQI